MDAPLPLRTEFLFRMSLTVGAPHAIGASRGADLRIVPVTGGTVSGPRLTAEVMPGPAGDWLRVEPDGTTHLDVRLTFLASGGGLVYCQYTGLRAGPPEVLARLGRGEAVAPEDYYFRTALRFETGAPDLAWLNTLIAVGVGQRLPSGPVYDVYGVM
ncbi:DUF3237 domain-containing protein [Methylobacterium frigidaeris]|uniref:UPF0311 protein MPEAHAMD_6335 n=1 Tax=Methylobacterium frigidaeris TaxID=2038277 RepID=A0AA37HIC6_9HYPH|nr:DUF3237 domain-containing protein [Methylobacterium frigidaeris]PIK74196.1 hypothetical protein CS379_03885 [Methylobacterium frigidaeris]GJD66139.1 hypothetical protein MPEAHAMD_6335 [Methylobacterium frigidaeris]